MQSNNGHAIEVEIEKLDGGFISNISGKRKIYNDAHDIDDEVCLRNILDKSENNEYILTIDLRTKDAYTGLLKEQNIVVEDKPEEVLISRDMAREMGIIQPADVFDPVKKIPVDNRPISINEKNAYKVNQLSSIDWKHYDEMFPLTIREKSVITGINVSTMHGLVNKIATKSYSFQSISSRIGMTVLAKYYERLSAKTVSELISHKEAVPGTNSVRLLEIIAELELITNNNKFIKSGILQRKILEMKKVIR